MIPSPETPAQMLMARPRSRDGKVLVMMDKVAGMMSAPPTPIDARVAINTPADGAKADATDPIAKVSSPAFNARLRPKRSPRAPMVSNRPANTRV
jgi:hypothetical protein